MAATLGHITPVTDSSHYSIFIFLHPPQPFRLLPSSLQCLVAQMHVLLYHIAAKPFAR